MGGGLAVADGTVFAVSYDSRVYAVDAATGEERWTLSDIRPGSPVVPVDGALFAHGYRDGNVYALW